MTLRDLFNDHKWHHGDLDRLGIAVRHRGAPDDERIVLGAEIAEVRANGLVVDAGLLYDEGEDPVFIPYHRVLRVTGPDGLLWAKTGPEDE